MLKSSHLHLSNPASTDDPNEYVRESFTFRRMAKWQVWAMSAVSAALLCVLIVSELI